MNIDLGSIAIGWREALIAVIVLVAAYMLVVLLRMRRLHGAAGAEALPGRREPPPAVPEPPSAPDWQATQAQLAQDAFMRGVEAEMAQLREELDALRGELAALRDEMRHELGHVRAAQTVSPIYSDAMQMAQLGHDAATIAERCGIARAEAELVLALVRSQNN